MVQDQSRARDIQGKGFILMAPLRSTRLDWWPRDSLRRKVSTSSIFMLQSVVLPPFGCLLLGNNSNACVHHMDMKTTFLNGDLSKEIYIEQPE